MWTPPKKIETLTVHRFMEACLEFHESESECNSEIKKRTWIWGRDTFMEGKMGDG